jgi:hypothetical protein
MLNATTGTGLSYQWQLGGVPIPGETNSSHDATMSGDYSVIITNATGCSDIAVISITLAPTPSNTVALSGPLTFCAGSSVTMTASAGAGYTYQWYNTSGVISGATNISYTTSTSGTYSVTITNSFGCSNTSLGDVVVVNALPSAAIIPGGFPIFCAGGNVTLNASSTPGLTYQWLVGGAPIPGATNSAYIATASGGYRVVVTDPATGCVNTTGADTVITAVASASATPLTPAEYCWGGSAWLGASVTSSTGAVTYQWFNNSTTPPSPISGAVNSTYNVTTPGIYSVRIIIATTPTCSVMSSTTTVVEHPLPNPVLSYNGTTQVFSTQNYFVSYQWFKNFVAIPGATSLSTPATGNGNYKVQVTDTNGCQSFSEAYILTNFGSGGGGPGGPTTQAGTINNGDVQIYPNPATEVVHIYAPQAVRAVVRAIDGRSLINVDNATDIHIGNLADGIYTIMIYDSNDQLLKAEKLVKATR